MPTSYNQIAGQSLERLAAPSDGIFAVAMTLLVLDTHALGPHAVKHRLNSSNRSCCSFDVKAGGVAVSCVRSERGFASSAATICGEICLHTGSTAHGLSRGCKCGTRIYPTDL